ncbi:MAG TPA: Gfo/Idh/MocA family oxidoreductase, partial [Fimbriimonas sp.]
MGVKKIGVMGCGVVADYGHLPSIVATPGLELTALFDPDPVRLKAQTDRYQVPGFSTQEAFFGQQLDAVVVASPAWAHRENVLGAAAHGIHVLCEKPIAMDDAEGEEMIRAMEGADRMFFIGYVYRFSPVAMQMKRWIDEGTVGRIRSLRLIYCWDLHGRYEQQPDGAWVESPRWQGRMEEGGPMVDCGVHQIDLARWWVGSEVARTTVAAAWVADYAAPDHVYLHLDHADGAHTMVEMSFTYGHTAKEPAPIFSYDLIGDGGTLRYDRNGYVLEARTGRETIRVPGASEKNFAGMYLEFERALRTGETGHMPTARDGLIATRLAREATDRAMA